MQCLPHRICEAQPPLPFFLLHEITLDNFFMLMNAIYLKDFASSASPLFPQSNQSTNIYVASFRVHSCLCLPNPESFHKLRDEIMFCTSLRRRKQWASAAPLLLQHDKFKFRGALGLGLDN